MKTHPLVNQSEVRRLKQTHFNPVRGLCPSRLALLLDDFKRGELREAALLFDAIRERDDTLCAVSGKREKSISRKDYTIETFEDSDRAELHRQVLDRFFANLTATRVDCQDMRGGLRTLIRNMMLCVGDRYAVHEIVWKALDQGNRVVVEGGGEARMVTAEFRFVPLWFFENKTGKLRFKATPYATDGDDMTAGDWLVSVGDGLMSASSIAYLFKVTPLQDWAIYSERHGMPAFLGKTDADPGTEQWNAMEDAVAALTKEFAGVAKNGDSIDVIQLGGQGELPYPKLVERMDRAIATLWRGADLSTMSAGAGEGTGASVQGEETDLLEDDDAAMIEDALHDQVSRFVIKYATGDDFALARLALDRPQRADDRLEMDKDRFLIEHGVEVAKEDLRERHGRRAPVDGEEIAARPAAPAVGSLPGFGNEGPTPELPEDLDEAEDELLAKARMALGQAQAEDFAGLRQRIEAIRELEDPAAQLKALRDLDANLADYVAAGDRSAEVFEQVLAAATVNGAERSPRA